MDPGEQFKLVRRLLKEQDLVLEQLDELNARIEQTLRELAPKTEPIESETDVGTFESQKSRAA